MRTDYRMNNSLHEKTRLIKKADMAHLLQVFIETDSRQDPFKDKGRKTFIRRSNFKPDKKKSTTNKENYGVIAATR